MEKAQSLERISWARRLKSRVIGCKSRKITPKHESLDKNPTILESSVPSQVSCIMNGIMVSNCPGWSERVVMQWNKGAINIVRYYARIRIFPSSIWITSDVSPSLNNCSFTYNQLTNIMSYINTAEGVKMTSWQMMQLFESPAHLQEYVRYTGNYP